MALFINIGFGNMVNTDKIVSIVATDAAPIKRMIQSARDDSRAVDATCGRRTRTVLVMESGHMVLSALTTDTIALRCRAGETSEEKTGEKQVPQSREKQGE